MFLCLYFARSAVSAVSVCLVRPAGFLLFYNVYEQIIMIMNNE